MIVGQNCPNFFLLNTLFSSFFRKEKEGSKVKKRGREKGSELLLCVVNLYKNERKENKCHFCNSALIVRR